MGFMGRNLLLTGRHVKVSRPDHSGGVELDRWIVIPRWDGPDGFQHYSSRDPVWIKNYTRLLHSDEYRSLSFAQRGILHGLWMEYAASGRNMLGNTLELSRKLGHQVTERSLQALNHAGFIEFSASKPLAPRYTRIEKEKKPPISPKPKPPKLEVADGRPDPSAECVDCGERLGHGHLETCPRMPRLVVDVA